TEPESEQAWACRLLGALGKVRLNRFHAFRGFRDLNRSCFLGITANGSIQGHVAVIGVYVDVAGLHEFVVGHFHLDGGSDACVCARLADSLSGFFGRMANLFTRFLGAMFDGASSVFGSCASGELKCCEKRKKARKK